MLCWMNAGKGVKMRFWDSSALVPLFIQESSSSKVWGWLKEDPHVVVWHFTVTEIWSAVCRRYREGQIALTGLSAVQHEIEKLSSGWVEIMPSRILRDRSHRLLALHHLRAADALQLASALIATEDHTLGQYFYCLDHNLAQAAQREGFSVPAL